VLVAAARDPSSRVGPPGRLLTIDPGKSATRVLVRLISVDHYNDDVQLAERGGYTVWALKTDGRVGALQRDTLTDAVDFSLAT
jgi:hypothetical protein